MSEKQQKLVLSIIDFLNDSINNGTVKQDDRESLEVAVQCIGEAFGVDSTDEAQVQRLSIKPATLSSIFDVFLQMKQKVGAAPAAATVQASVGQSSKGPSPADKVNADKKKAEGNSLMSSKQYDAAIAAYTEAIALDPTNAVFFSNRAAAHSSKGDHTSAIADAEKAIELDPDFTKAYHRLGHAHYSLENYEEAASAFRRGLTVDANNPGLKTGLSNAEARIPAKPTTDDGTTVDRSADAGAAAPEAGGFPGLGGMGGFPGMGGGGMPDIASMMNNPMMMQMAQQMMSNGGLERMMQNPAVANMMERLQGGGAMPSMADLMSDPSLRDIASQFNGGAAGAP